MAWDLRSRVARLARTSSPAGTRRRRYPRCRQARLQYLARAEVLTEVPQTGQVRDELPEACEPSRETSQMAVVESSGTGDLREGDRHRSEATVDLALEGQRADGFVELEQGLNADYVLG